MNARPEKRIDRLSKVFFVFALLVAGGDQGRDRIIGDRVRCDNGDNGDDVITLRKLLVDDAVGLIDGGLTATPWFIREAVFPIRGIYIRQRGS